MPSGGAAAVPWIVGYASSPNALACGRWAAESSSPTSPISGPCLTPTYTRGLDFIDPFSVPGPAGVPLLVHLRRWRFQDILLRPTEGEVIPGTTVTLSIAAVVGELDALADRARRHGGGELDGPADTPLNTRDLRTRDPDGPTAGSRSPSTASTGRSCPASGSSTPRSSRCWGRPRGSRPSTR